MHRTATALILDAMLFTGIAEALLHFIAGVRAAPDPLETRSSILGALAVAPAVLCLFLLAIVSGLPSGRLACVSLGSLWVAFGSAPLFLWLPSDASPHPLWGALYLCFVLLLLLWMLRQTGGRPWLLSTDLLPLRPRSSAGVGVRLLGGSFAALILGSAYAALAVLAWVQFATRGFVSFDLAGVDLADRRYALDQREVRLVGMMHLGERDRYRELVRSFVAEGTVVLFEGVTDDQHLVDAKLDYGGAAAALGLEAQHDFTTYLEEIEPSEVDGVSPSEWPVLRHADLDMSAFSEETRDFVARVSELWTTESLLGSIRDYLAWFEAEGGTELFSSIENDLIERRNAHLLEEMNAAFKEFDRVVVPWGALHLPGIERSLLASGFSEVEREERRLISWWNLTGGR